MLWLGSGGDGFGSTSSGGAGFFGNTMGDGNGSNWNSGFDNWNNQSGNMMLREGNTIIELISFIKNLVHVTIKFSVLF